MELNLGSGEAVREDCVNVDLRRMTGVDVVVDLDDHPWPFRSDCAEQIRASDCFEHLEDVVAAMDECHRLLCRGGLLYVKGPRAGEVNVWSDVTHRRAFTEKSFDHFDPDTPYGRKYDYGKGKWRIVDKTDEGANVEFWLRRRDDG